MFKSSVIELKQPAGAVLFDLGAFPTGSEAVLERISSGQPGIYAWFRSFNFREDPEGFEADLMEAIAAPKFQSRTGSLAPYYEVSLRSKSSMPDVKRRALHGALKNPDFCSALRFSLDWAMLLQAPLYVGKSIDLKARLTQHLRIGSPLHERLREAGIAIDKCHLLVVPLSTPSVVLTSAQGEQEDSSQSELAHELIFEEIFSRLFNPAFTTRIG